VAELEGAGPGFGCPPENGCKRLPNMPKKPLPPASFLSGDSLRLRSRSRECTDQRDVLVLGWAKGFVGSVG
jgi:hypothetical protein